MAKLRVNIPFGLLLITVFYMFGAVVLLILMFANPVQTSNAIAKAHGLPTSTGNWILPLAAGLALLIAYGLFSLSRWGYVLSILYLAYFGSVNGLMLTTHADSIYLGNLLWSLLAIIYLILARRSFQTS